MMNIYAKRGDKVVCVTFDAGYVGDKETAKKYLNKNSVYTVEKTVPHSFDTEVYLQEFPGVSFNTAFFKDYSEE